MMLAAGSGCRPLPHTLPALPVGQMLPSTNSGSTETEQKKLSAETLTAERVLASTVMQSAKGAIRPKKVDSRGWYCDASDSLYSAAYRRVPRWHHLTLEALLAEDPVPVDVIQAGTQSTQSEIRATATIGLLKLEKPVEEKELHKLVADRDLLPGTLAALIESIALSNIPEHIEMLEGLGRERTQLLEGKNIDAMTQRQVEETVLQAWAIANPKGEWLSTFPKERPEIQEAMLDLLLANPQGNVPGVVINRFDSLSPQSMQRLGLWQAYLRSVAPLHVVQDHTRSADMKTRQSAIIGLGRIDTAESRKRLLRIDENASTLDQKAAVVAWGLIRDHDHWPTLARSSSWRVREEVAQWIPAEPQWLDLAKDLSEDQSVSVQDAILARQISFEVEIAEVEPVDEPEELEEPNSQSELSQAERLEILKQIETANQAATFGERRRAQNSLESQPSKVLETTESVAEAWKDYENQYLFENLLPTIEPVYGLLRGFRQGEEQTAESLRRLSQASAEQQIPELLMWKLSRRVGNLRQQQWQRIFEIIENDSRSPAAQIALQSLEHPEPMVRLSGCRYFVRFPAQGFDSKFTPLLEDELSGCRACAVEAMAADGLIENTSTIVPLLYDADLDVQIAVATALHQVGDSKGWRHLVRMTYNPSPKTRLAAAKSLTSMAQPDDVAELIRLLDEDASIRRLALQRLSQVVNDPAAPQSDQSYTSQLARCDAWKNWFKRQKTSPKS